ncbi:MAG: hypothetical protein R2685_07525 [Candidatus Nitrosocosmicus sp.]|nr:hypothetical protein [Candidatus Nitrosocosmicus sp.]
MSKLTTNDYHLLAVNAGIIGSLFIYFAIAVQLPPLTIFDIDSEKCSFGFHLTSEQAQISVVISVGILLIPFSVSSILIVSHIRMASLFTNIGFALIITTAVLILSSLSCRIPSAFFYIVMVLPAAISILTVILLFYFRQKKINQS